MKRVKQLYNEGIILKCTQKILFLFEEKVTIEQYVDLDEVVVLYYLKKWIQEDDAILSDLARRFINRDLFKYIPFDGSIITITELQELFIEVILIRTIILLVRLSLIYHMIMIDLVLIDNQYIY